MIIVTLLLLILSFDTVAYVAMPPLNMPKADLLQPVLDDAPIAPGLASTVWGEPTWFRTTATIDECKDALESKKWHPDAVGSDRQTGLTFAVMSVKPDLLKLLLKHGASPSAKSPIVSETPLHSLIRKGYIQENDMIMLDELLKAKPDINAQDWRGRTPMHHIGIVQNPIYRTIIFKKLFDHGASLNAQDDNGDTPLHYMFQILQRDYSWYRDVLFKPPYIGQINPTLKNKQGFNALEQARANNFLMVVQLLANTGLWPATADDKEATLSDNTGFPRPNLI